MTSPRIPRAHPDSPPPPGPHDLGIRDDRVPAVLVDTNVLFQMTYRKPLAASASAGDLVVYWSASIAAEFVRVARREVADAVARRLSAASPEQRARAVEQAIEVLNIDLGAQLATLRQYFRIVPAIPTAGASALTDVVDLDDRLHILAAHSVGAPYLLTLDDRHLPHGAVFAGVQCRHPDTFLTLFYQQNPDAYTRTRRSIAHLSDALRVCLLP